MSSPPGWRHHEHDTASPRFDRVGEHGNPKLACRPPPPVAYSHVSQRPHLQANPAHEPPIPSIGVCGRVPLKLRDHPGVKAAKMKGESPSWNPPTTNATLPRKGVPNSLQSEGHDRRKWAPARCLVQRPNCRGISNTCCRLGNDNMGLSPSSTHPLTWEKFQLLQDSRAGDRCNAPHLPFLPECRRSIRKKGGWCQGRQWHEVLFK